jgi:hypothetical protein
LAIAPLKLFQCSRTVVAVILHALDFGAKIMQERFRMFRRAGGNFYARDKITGRSESLSTSERTQAKQLLAARNQAAAQPQLNRTMAKAYLSAKSPELLTRTWADVMEHYSVTGVESTRKRKATAFRSRPFAHLRGLGLIDTEAAHLLAVLEHERAGNSAHHYLRRLHNYALHLGWLLMPVMADAAWPEVRKRKFAAITEEEHRRIVDRSTTSSESFITKCCGKRAERRPTLPVCTPIKSIYQTRRFAFAAVSSRAKTRVERVSCVLDLPLKGCFSSYRRKVISSPT